METRAHHVLIGFFTLVVASGGVLFGLWLAKTGSRQDTQLYDIVFREAVSGLTVGSTVEYSGIPVGEVARLTLDPRDPRQVLARVRLQAGTPVKTDTHARLALANITGAANIQLGDGSPESPLLQAEGNEVPVIIADTSPISLLRVSSEEILVDASALLSNAKRLLSNDNIVHINRVLANLDATTSVITAQKDTLARGIEDLAQASRELKTTLIHASRLLARFDGQLSDRGERLLANADSTLVSLERISGQLEQLLTDNHKTLEDGLQGIAELGPTIREMRITLANLGELTRNMQDGPAGYLLGRDPVKEFKP